MQRRSEQENSREGGADTMSRHVDQSVKRKDNRADKRSEPDALICSFAQWKYMRNDERDADENQRDAGPAEFAPEPEPVALRMKRARVGDRSDA